MIGVFICTCIRYNTSLSHFQSSKYTVRVYQSGDYVCMIKEAATSIHSPQTVGFITIYECVALSWIVISKVQEINNTICCSYDSVTKSAYNLPKLSRHTKRTEFTVFRMDIVSAGSRRCLYLTDRSVSCSYNLCPRESDTRKVCSC